MHFVFTNPRFLPVRTGPARVSDALARAAIARGHRVTVVTSERKPPAGDLSYPVKRFDRRAHGLASWLDATRPDAVIAHEVRNPLTDAVVRWAAQGRSRVAVMPHGGLTAIPFVPNAIQRMPYRVRDALRPPVSAGLLVIGTCASETVSLEAERGGRNPVGTFYLGTDAAPQERARPTNPKPRLLMAGNLGDVRNPQWFLDAIKKIRSKGFDVDAVVAGPLQRQSRFAPKPRLPLSHDLSYMGLLSPERLSAEMERCDLFVYPTRYESFGLPVLEAAVLGRPVLTTAHGIANELSLSSCGRLAPSHHGPAFADALASAVAALPELTIASEARRPALAAWAAWTQRARPFLDWLEGGVLPEPQPPPTVAASRV